LHREQNDEIDDTPAWEIMLNKYREERAHTYNMCEWGVINQLEKGVEEKATIGFLRPAVAAQALISFRPDIQEPHDLVDQPIATAQFTGQHYTTMQLLEGTLRRDQFDWRFYSAMRDMLDVAREGEVAAASVMEPHISLALKEGAHIVASSFYRGGQIFGSAIAEETRSAYVRAINGAVDIINADRNRYRAFLAESTGGQLAPEELSLLFHRYTHAKPYTEKRFEETYAWMQSWDLVSGDNTYETLISPVI
jgi:NitT/TauT family transport system substrate-binding protein